MPLFKHNLSHLGEMEATEQRFNLLRQQSNQTVSVLLLIQKDEKENIHRFPIALLFVAYFPFLTNARRSESCGNVVFGCPAL